MRSRRGQTTWPLRLRLVRSLHTNTLPLAAVGPGRDGAEGGIASAFRVRRFGLLAVGALLAAGLVWRIAPADAMDTLVAMVDQRGSDQRGLRLEDLPAGMVSGGNSYRTVEHPDPRARLPVGARDLYITEYDGLRPDGSCCDTTVISQVARFDSDEHARLFVPAAADSMVRVAGRDAVLVTIAEATRQETVALRVGPIAHFVTVRSATMTLEGVRTLAVRLVERQLSR